MGDSVKPDPLPGGTIHEGRSISRDEVQFNVAALSFKPNPNHMLRRLPDDVKIAYC